MSVGCGTDISFESEENISIFNSSDWAERGFCMQCGSHLFYRLKETKQHWVPVGLFEDHENMTFDLQVFIEEKPDYYCFSNATENITGAQLFAKFSPPE
ncbi:MAG: GFA family protein [Gammaproteobacteria bacterium]